MSTNQWELLQKIGFVRVSGSAEEKQAAEILREEVEMCIRDRDLTESHWSLTIFVGKRKANNRYIYGNRLKNNRRSQSPVAERSP